jgi:hypothetical protein
MWIRITGLGLLVALIGGLGSGCNKSAPAPLVLLPPPPPETVARIRWLGKERVAADTNAASLMAIWNLPESRNIEGLMLDRLAAGLLTTNGVAALTNQFHPAAVPPGATNSPQPVFNYQSRVTGTPALLRPLLADLLEQESYLEVRQATNLPGELALAIRLKPERARLWETNLAAVLESITGSRATPAPGRTNGWQLAFHSPQPTVQSPPAAGNAPRTTHHVPRTLELSREGEWTVIGLGDQTNALAAEVLGLIQRTGLPFAPQAKDSWLYAQVDPRRVASALSLDWDLPADLPRMTLGVTGDGQSVHTRGKLDFPKPLPADLGQWNIPTHLIHDPLISFTAIRGLGPWLASQKWWRDVFPGAPASQLYFWAERGLPFLSFCAARLPNASNQVSQLAGRLIQQANPWLATNTQGSFQRQTNGNGVVWTNLLLTEPFLESLPGSADDLVYGGLLRELSTNRPPEALFLQLTGPTNLVAYDWEVTGARAWQWLYFGQFFRLFLHRAQLPPQCASIDWLTATEYKLGNCGSAVTRPGPAQLSLARSSTMGFNAVELHLLADWFESPQFPRGLNTLLGPPGPAPGHLLRSPHKRSSRTNSVPAIKR